VLRRPNPAVPTNNSESTENVRLRHQIVNSRFLLFRRVLSPNLEPIKFRKNARRTKRVEWAAHLGPY
jgi:hypothetical protein